MEEEVSKHMEEVPAHGDWGGLPLRLQMGSQEPSTEKPAKTTGIHRAGWESAAQKEEGVMQPTHAGQHHFHDREKKEPAKHVGDEVT